MRNRLLPSGGWFISLLAVVIPPGDVRAQEPEATYRERTVAQWRQALRDPSPEFAAKVASGASDLAAGLTTILRAFNAATARPQPAPRPPEGGPTWRAATHDEDWPEPEAAAGDDPWQAATRSVPQPRKVAKKAVRKPPPAPPADEPA